MDEFELPMEISGELRLYQRAGISWLAFLRRCGLHGVLADEMGLGKTLQATAIVVCKALLAVLSDTRILFKQAVHPWTDVFASAPDSHLGDSPSEGALSRRCNMEEPAQVSRQLRWAQGRPCRAPSWGAA